MAESTNTNDTNTVPRLHVAPEWRVHGYASAQQRRRQSRWDVVRNLEGEVAINTNVVGVSTVGHGAVLVFRIIRDHRPIAEGVITVCTFLTRLLGISVEACPYLRANPDSFSNTEMLHVGASDSDLTDDFVAEHARVHRWLPPTIKVVDIRPADSAVRDFDLHIFGTKKAALVLEGYDLARRLVGCIGVHYPRRSHLSNG
ncbi:hypothetical protein ON010_g13824 [Phytophthora cinnamomi]|nr:hypothetical protein ON010_g13824 [Phytophthora cinnamomi]